MTQLSVEEPGHSADDAGSSVADHTERGGVFPAVHAVRRGEHAAMRSDSGSRAAGAMVDDRHALFVHSGFWALVLNAYLLFIFGPRLEQAWGTRVFRNFFFWCGLGGWLAHVSVCQGCDADWRDGGSAWRADGVRTAMAG